MLNSFEAEDLEARPAEVPSHQRSRRRALHEYRCGRGSGIEVETDTAVVFRVREGRVIRIQPYMDQAAALEAAGLEE
jgi:ketosteroid isomerase-like protein